MKIAKLILRAIICCIMITSCNLKPKYYDAIFKPYKNAKKPMLFAPELSLKGNVYKAGYFIVNKINGLKYDLVSDPYLSPNRKYILSFGGSLEYIVPPVLQVWIIKDDRLVKKFELETLDNGFSIEEIRWITDDKQAVRIGFGTEKQAYGIMTIK